MCLTSLQLNAGDLDALITGVQEELPATAHMLPNEGQVSLLDYGGVTPDRYKTDGASDALYEEAKKADEAFRIVHPGKQPASGEQQDKQMLHQ